MRGLLIYTINYNPDKKYKLIVNIHGGGFGSVIMLKGTIFRECTVLEWHLWTSLFNCIVFIPEFYTRPRVYFYLGIIQILFEFLEVNPNIFTTRRPPLA